MRQGFTFIEILVVLMIMGIFLTATTFGIQGARESARDTARQAHLAKIQSALGRFYADCFEFPTRSEFYGAQSAGQLVGIPTKAPSCYSTNIYLEDFPTDPEDPDVTYSYTQVDTENYVLCASLVDPPKPAQDTSSCGSCGSRSCNIIVTN